MNATYYFEDFLWWLPGLISGVPTVAFRVGLYVLSALALYTVARRRCIRKPWMAWIPVVNCWQLGSLSDQYRYVVKGQIKSKRKILLILRITQLVMNLLLIVMAIAALAPVLFHSSWKGNSLTGTMLISLLLTTLPYLGVVIGYAVVRYMALFDVYRSMDPENAVLFLVLSILFRPTEAFFLFFNRDKDVGMPPRRGQSAPQEPPAQPEAPTEAVEEILEYVEIRPDNTEFL